ncbi:MAG: nucleotidyltransferase domain-containing protein [Planctomycetes bacterium]|nr:nucleotidyltransferase domain-containing protein [Planctomycetota bacterium]
MLDPSIVKTVQVYIQAVRSSGIEPKFVIVFGSWAKGCADEWSDIDLVVVSPLFDRARRLKDALLLWEVAAETDCRIEPVPCGEKQWTDDDSSAILEIARREGKRIAPEGKKQPACF